MEDKKNVISFINMKGGVGKTTLCKEISLFLSERKDRRILVIDIDPQANCTQSFFEKYKVLKIEDEKLITNKLQLPSIENIFSKSKDRLRKPSLGDIIYELNNNLHIIPGSLDTVFMERETGNGSAEQKLVNFIYDFELKKKYDYIFIDCPPTYSFYTVSALLSSNYYLVPLVPDMYSLLGLDLLERVVCELKSLYRSNFNNNYLENFGIVFTKVPKKPNKGMRDNVEQIKINFPNYFFKNKFTKVEKLSTSKLEKFIIDRNDTELIENLSMICEEFEERMKEING